MKDTQFAAVKLPKCPYISATHDVEMHDTDRDNDTDNEKLHSDHENSGNPHQLQYLLASHDVDEYVYLKYNSKGF